MHSVISKILGIIEMDLKSHFVSLKKTFSAKFIQKTAIYCPRTAKFGAFKANIESNKVQIVDF
jgi:hypothetical protein